LKAIENTNNKKNKTLLNPVHRTLKMAFDMMEQAKKTQWGDN
jgi:hypothetical protein